MPDTGEINPDGITNENAGTSISTETSRRDVPQPYVVAPKKAVKQPHCPT
jgi:hypothetical protein